MHKDCYRSSDARQRASLSIVGMGGLDLGHSSARKASPSHSSPFSKTSHHDGEIRPRSSTTLTAEEAGRHLATARRKTARCKRSSLGTRIVHNGHADPPRSSLPGWRFRQRCDHRSIYVSSSLRRTRICFQHWRLRISSS